MAEEGKPLGQLVADLQREFPDRIITAGAICTFQKEIKQSAIQRARAESTESLGRYRVVKKENLRWHQIFLDAPTGWQRSGSLDPLPCFRHGTAVTCVRGGRLAGVGSRDPGQPPRVLSATADTELLTSTELHIYRCGNAILLTEHDVGREHIFEVKRFARGAALQPDPALAGHSPTL